MPSNHMVCLFCKILDEGLISSKTEIERGGIFTEDFSKETTYYLPLPGEVNLCFLGRFYHHFCLSGCCCSNL